MYIVKDVLISNIIWVYFVLLYFQQPPTLTVNKKYSKVTTRFVHIKIILCMYVCET